MTPYKMISEIVKAIDYINEKSLFEIRLPEGTHIKEITDLFPPDFDHHSNENELKEKNRIEMFIEMLGYDKGNKLESLKKNHKSIKEMQNTLLITSVFN